MSTPTTTPVPIETTRARAAEAPPQRRAGAERRAGNVAPDSAREFAQSAQRQFLGRLSRVANGAQNGRCARYFKLPNGVGSHFPARRSTPLRPPTLCFSTTPEA